LRPSLEAYKRSVWVDLRDIPPSADWRDEIHQAIISSDAFVCVISPDYVDSPICQEELEFARANNKRLIPVIRRDISTNQAPLALAALNWIFFRETDNQSAAFGKLLSALDTDLPYVRSGSRLLVRAKEWEGKGRNASFMLRGKDLSEAEQWLATSGGKQPAPSQEQTQFIFASRHASTRRQRTTIGVLTVGILITLALSIISTTLYKVTNDQNVILRGHNIAGKANDALTNSHLDQGLALAVAASKQSDDFDTRNALLNGLDSASYLDAVLVGAQPHGASADYTDVSYSSDGTTIMAMDSLTPHVLLWNGATHKLRLTIVVPQLPDRISGDGTRYPDTLSTAALSPDGRYVATKNFSSGIRLWRASTGKLVAGVANSHSGDYTDDTQSDTGSMRFSPNSSMLAWSECTDDLCQSPQIGLYDLQLQTLLPPLTERGSSSLGFEVTLAFSQDGSRLAVGLVDSLAFLKNKLGARVDIFDLASGAMTETVSLASDSAHGQAGDVRALAFSPDGTMLAIGGDLDPNANTGQVLFWNLAQRTFSGPPLTDSDGSIDTIAFSPRGAYIVTGMGGGDFGLRLWNVRLRASVTPVLRGHVSVVNAVAFSPNGSQFTSSGRDGQVFIWRLAPYSPLSHLGLDGFNALGQVAFSPNGALMATANTNAVELWDMRTGARVRTLAIPASDRNNADDDVCGLAFSPDSKTLAAGDELAQVLLWNVTTGALLGLPLRGHQIIIPGTLYNFVMDLSFSPDGSKLVSSGLDGHAILWDLKLLAPIQAFPGVGALEQQAAFSPDGRYLAIAGSLQDITIWDVASLSVVRTLNSNGVYVRAVAFYPHHTGMLAALDTNGAITTWDATKGATVGQPLASGALADSIFSPHLVFNAAGDELVASHDLTITLWDVSQPGQAQRYVRVIVPQYSQLNTTLSPDGRYLATATVGEVEVRYATLAGWHASACAIANRTLTQNEWSQLLPNTPYQAAC
jgi:WD40 repeat protein